MILDACVAAPLFVPHSLSVPARALVHEHRLAAPATLYSEVANTLRKYARRGELTATDIAEALVHLDGIMDMVVPERDLLPAAVAIAVGHAHPVYDCLYLAVALERREPLATADRRMAAIAESLSIETELIGPAS